MVLTVDKVVVVVVDAVVDVVAAVVDVVWTWALLRCVDSR